MRTELLKATCTPAEKEALRAIAAQECQKQAEVLRFLVRQEAKNRGLWMRGDMRNAQKAA